VMTGAALTDVALAIDEMERDRVILHYSPIINWDRTDRERVEAMIEVRVTPQRDQGFDAVAEPLRVQHPEMTEEEVRDRVMTAVKLVRLPEEALARYPHQFSGGQRQRICIARALTGRPEFLICDEPTSALDVSVQAQVLNLMRELQQEIGITYLFISHNLAVVHHMSSRVGVMYLGRLVETGDRESLFSEPLHPYTKMLMEAIPSIEEGARRAPAPLGEVPSPLLPPSGCPFHPRCPRATKRCREEAPAVVTVTGRNGPRTVACHLVESA